MGTISGLGGAMGRLKAIAPRLSTLKPVLGFAPGDERAGDQQRNMMAPWRVWYATARWRDLRRQVFLRDGFICQRTGQLCVGRYPHPLSPVANHKRPHKGNAELFWDIDNIETVTKAVHDGLIQSEERALRT